MRKTPKVFGWRWVTYSRWEMFWSAVCVFVGLAALALCLYGIVSGGDPVDILVPGILGLGITLFPSIITIGVFVGPAHLYRAPMIGRPRKVARSEIDGIWPLAHLRVDSAVGGLIELHSSAFVLRKREVEWFDKFGREFAELLGVEYDPEPRPWPGKQAPPWSTVE